MNKKLKNTIIIFLCILLIFLTSFLTIKVYKAYAVHHKYNTCLAWEYNFKLDNIEDISVAVIENPYGFEETKKYILDSGSYMIVYPNSKKTYYCQELNCFYDYVNNELVSLYFSMNDFPGESYMVYDLK